MNYYPHHIGDYLKDTAHLTMIEDGAYRRLIDLYYQHEQPLPADKRQIYRLARASSTAERKAIDSVLTEYFVAEPDGWTHSRCEEEIEAAQEKSGDSDARRENERERQRRHRQRRAQLFEALRRHDVVPPYDTSTAELVTLLERYEKTDPERDVTQDVTRDVTANQYPITNNQEPKKEEGDAHANPGGNPDPIAAATAYGTMAKLLRQSGVEVQSGNPEFRAWVDNGLTQDEAVAALESARRSKPAPEPIAWGYLAACLRTNRQKAAAGVPAKGDAQPRKEPVDTWWKSDAGIERKGRELGLFARGNENHQAFKDRIFDEIRKREGKAA